MKDAAKIGLKALLAALGIFLLINRGLRESFLALRDYYPTLSGDVATLWATSESKDSIVSQRLNVHGASTLFPKNSPPMPKWLSDYIEFHQSSLEMDQNGNYKVNEGVPNLKLTRKSGGLGDRMSTLIALFYLAICNNRVFLVDPISTKNIGRFLEPRLIQWNAKRPSTPTTPEVFNGNQQLHNTTIFNTKSTDMDMHGPNLMSNFHLLKRNQCPQNLTVPTNVQNMTVPRDHSYEMESGIKKEANTLYYYLFNSLFDFSPSVKNRTQHIWKKVGMDDEHNPYIAVHIRRGDAHFGEVFADPRHARHGGNETVQKFYNCSKKIQVKMQQCLGRSNYLPKIYVASDTSETKREFQNEDPATIRFMDDMEILHIDRSNFTTFKDLDLAAIDVWSDVQILTESTCLVYSRSGFSELAAWVGSSPRCAVRFDECTDDNIQQALGNIGC